MPLSPITASVAVNGQLIRWLRAGGGGDTTTVPGAPSGVGGTADSSTTAVLTWGAPATDGGTPVTGYVVSRDGPSPYTTTVGASARSLRFLSLSPSTVYHLSVAAINATGTGTAATRTVTTPGSGGGGPLPGGERFPGDPNPKVTGKLFWGCNSDNLVAHEAASGVKLAVVRRYWPLSASHTEISVPSGAVPTAVRGDHSNNRLPVVSFKLDQATVAAGGFDTQLDALFAELESYPKPSGVVCWHEPENDNIPPATFVAAQQRIRARLDAYRAAHPGQPHRVTFCGCLMDYTFNPQSGRNPASWVPPAGTWDVLLGDIYAWTSGTDIESVAAWPVFKAFVEAHNMPYGLGEWGIHPTDPNGAARMLKFYNDMLDGSHDLVWMTYFDRSANWKMTDDNGLLTQFHSIMKDSRALHLSDLGY